MCNVCVYAITIGGFNYGISSLIFDLFKCLMCHCKAWLIVFTFPTSYVGFNNVFYPGNNIVSGNVNLNYFSYYLSHLHQTYSYRNPVSLSSIIRKNISIWASFTCYFRSKTKFPGTSNVTTSIYFQDFEPVWVADLHNAILGLTIWNVCSINRIMYDFPKPLLNISFLNMPKTDFLG